MYFVTLHKGRPHKEHGRIKMIQKWSKIGLWFTFLAQCKRIPVTKIDKKIKTSFICISLQFWSFIFICALSCKALYFVAALLFFFFFYLSQDFSGILGNSEQNLTDHQTVNIIHWAVSIKKIFLVYPFPEQERNPPPPPPPKKNLLEEIALAAIFYFGQVSVYRRCSRQRVVLLRFYQHP